jgi:hypothetical protein
MYLFSASVRVKIYAKTVPRFLIRVALAGVKRPEMNEFESVVQKANGPSRFGSMGINRVNQNSASEIGGYFQVAFYDEGEGRATTSSLAILNHF